MSGLDKFTVQQAASDRTVLPIFRQHRRSPPMQLKGNRVATV